MRRVARTVGGMSDPNILEAARDSISEAIQDWNTEKDWRFLQIIAPDIVMDGSTNRWPLPTNFKKPYDAYLKGLQIKLEYVEARLHDTLFPGGTSIAGGHGYSLYNVGTTGEIETLPNAVADTLVVRYYRPMVEIGGDGDYLDLPSRYVPGILAKARMLMCLDAKDHVGAKMWADIATARLAWAKRDDDRIPDEEIRFRPAIFTQNLNEVELDE